MKNKKKVKGYIFSRAFEGERVPQHVQNLVIRNYCSNNNLEYQLSASEYEFKDSHSMLYQMLDELGSIDGIIAYSIFQMTSDKYLRNKIINKLIKNKKSFYFSLEDMKVSNKEDLFLLDEIWNVKKSLSSCYIPS